jgi:hypothetical protein
MTELTPEQEEALAKTVLNSDNPVIELGVFQDNEEKSGGGVIDNALSTAREAMGTCADCIRAHLQNVSNFFGGRQNS